MNLEQKLEAVQNQLNEIKSELEADKRKQEELKNRNWPNEIKPGMLFAKWGVYYIVSRIERSMDLRLIGLQDGNRYSDDSLFGNNEKEFAYIGLAKDRIKIEDATHEPTGDELVGKLCQFSDDGENWSAAKHKCIGRVYLSGSMVYLSGSCMTWKYARLAR